MEKYIDLHTHSTASDGTDTPAAVVEKAKALDLAVVALTDHDTLSGLAEAREAGADLDQIVVPGCEISTRTDYGSLHIVGLWVPETNEKLASMLAHFRQERQRRNDKILAKLRELGLNISMEEVLAHTTSAVGRPHIATVLKEKGYVQSKEEAFSKYLGAGCPAYFPKAAPGPEETVRILNDMGATVVLAHPLLQVLPDGCLENIVSNLAACGLSGLEVWHSAQNAEQSAWLLKLVKKYNLCASGGSDYHGANKPRIEMGTGCGNLHIPLNVYENLLARRKAQGLHC